VRSHPGCQNTPMAIPLEELARQYVAHIEHHLDQLGVAR
jgi:hypothetical protein